MNENVLRLPQVLEICGLSRSSVYSMMKDGSFPKGFRLGTRAVGWRSTDIKQWIDNRAQTTKSIN